MAKQRARNVDPAYREEVLQLIANSDRPVSEIARDLGLDPRRVQKWIERERKEKGYLPTEESRPAEPSLEEAKQEIYLLKKRLRELEEERDILKKAISIFSQERK